MRPKATFTPLTSRESFKVLSEQEKKVRKAKQFGVQLMPGLGPAGPLAVRNKLNSSKYITLTANFVSLYKFLFHSSKKLKVLDLPIFLIFVPL